MSHALSGYIRDNPGGTGLSGWTVTLIDEATGVAVVPHSNMNLVPGTSDTSDANGRWEFTFDLSAGPMSVRATSGANNRYREPDELFMYGGYSISQLPQMLKAFGTGVSYGVGTEFNTTAAATRVLTAEPGYATIKGYLFGWDSGTKSVTGVANGSAGTTRHDFLVLRQYYEGVLKGRQELLIITGSSGADPVATTVEADLTQFIQGANIWDFPVARGKLAFGGTVYTVEDLVNTVTAPYASPYIPKIFQDVQIVGSGGFSGNVRIGNGASDKHVLYGQLEVNGSSPARVSAATDVANSSGTTVDWGTDTAFQFTTTSKASPSAGIVAEFTFETARDNSDFGVQLTALSSEAADLNVYVTSRGTGGFSVATLNAPGGGETLRFFATVIGK